MTHSVRRRALSLLTALGTTLAVACTPAAEAQTQQPNIIVIMADDVGWFNIGVYSHGMMVPTPNIDRIAREGIMFTDHYAEPSCTPGRAAFITGQMPIRTGLTTVSGPGAEIGLHARDTTLAEVLKEVGYVTGQTGKNHLGDRNSHLPTVHGFDMFFGNLYHLNTEEEPEDPDWPKDEKFNRDWRPRGVLDCVATSEVNAEPDDPKYGAWGKQACKDTGPLTVDRMKTVEDEFEARAFQFIDESVASGKPFFLWHNPTRMHIYTHLRDDRRNLAQPYTSEWDVYGSGLMELDMYVGRMLDKLEEKGIEKNTIIIFTTDNGAMVSWWPDAGTTPFRGEKATSWEGGVRVPIVIRWPDQIPAGQISNGIQGHMDLFTTLAHAGGVPNVADKLRERDNLLIEGVDNLEHWKGKAPSARNHWIYYVESQYTALRIGNWKVHSQTREGFFDYLRPSALFFNLRMDPFERQDGQKSNDMAMKKSWIGGLVRDMLAEHFASFEKFPPRQKGGTLTPGVPGQPN